MVMLLPILPERVWQNLGILDDDVNAGRGSSTVFPRTRRRQAASEVGRRVSPPL
jgi:hypothetical protein